MNGSRSTFQRSLIQGVLGKVVRIGLSLASAALMARFLGVSQFGVFATAFLTFNLLSLLGGLQLTNEGARTSTGDLQKLVGWALPAGLSTSVALVALSLLLLPAQRDVALALLPYALLGLVKPLGEVGHGILAAHHQTTTIVAMGLWTQTFRIMGLIALGFDGSVSAIELACVDAFGGILLVAFQWRRSSQVASVHLSLDRMPFALLFSGVASLYLHSMAMLGIARADQFGLSLGGDLEAVGRYSSALKFVEVLNSLYLGLLVIFVPAISSARSIAEVRDTYQLAQRLGSAVLVPLLGSFAAYGAVIVQFAFGEEFSSSSLVYALLSLALAVHLLVGPLDYVLLGRKLDRPLRSVAGWTLLVGVPFAVGAGVLWGEVGAASGSVFMYVVYNARSMTVAKPHLPGVVSWLEPVRGALLWLITFACGYLCLRLGGVVLFFVGVIPGLLIAAGGALKIARPDRQQEAVAL